MHHARWAGLVLNAGLQFAAVPAPAQVPDSLSLAGDVGLVNAAGNTDLTTLSVGEEVRWRRGRLGLAQLFEVVYGRSGGQTTSSLWQIRARGEYALSGRISAYARLGYDRDRFAGIARRLEEGTGLVLALSRSTGDRLEGETGLSLVQQRSTQAEEDCFASSRLALAYTHHFTEQTYFRQTVEATANLETKSDYRLNTESALVAPLSGRFALKLSYVVRYDNRPEPGFRATDRLLTSGLQFTL